MTTAVDDEDAMNEAALVAHTCTLSAVTRVQRENEEAADSDPAVLAFVNQLSELLSKWAIKDMAVRFQHCLLLLAGELVASARTCLTLLSPQQVAYHAKMVGGAAEVSAPRGAASETADPGSARATAEVIFRHAQEAMSLGEAAVLSKDRSRSARSFHCAVM
jgi:hypothetical protein